MATEIGAKTYLAHTGQDIDDALDQMPLKALTTDADRKTAYEVRSFCRMQPSAADSVRYARTLRGRHFILFKLHDSDRSGLYCITAIHSVLSISARPISNDFECSAVIKEVEPYD